MIEDNLKKESSIPHPGLRQYDSVDDEIAADIDLILLNRFAPLYRKERYKSRKHVIEIFSPKVDYIGSKFLMKNADQIRFLLSLYPEKRDLAGIDKIILRPRHIEAGRVELMALFLRKTKTLVHYLYVPHTYDIMRSKASIYNEYLQYDIPRMINRQYNGADHESDMMIPSLLYIISMIGSSGNEVDKFFLRHQTSDSDVILAQLDEISDLYSYQGY
jgi:hypothetical protein